MNGRDTSWLRLMERDYLEAHKEHEVKGFHWEGLLNGAFIYYFNFTLKKHWIFKSKIKEAKLEALNQDKIYNFKEIFEIVGKLKIPPDVKRFKVFKLKFNLEFYFNQSFIKHLEAWNTVIQENVFNQQTREDQGKGTAKEADKSVPELVFFKKTKGRIVEDHIENYTQDEKGEWKNSLQGVTDLEDKAVDTGWSFKGISKKMMNHKGPKVRTPLWERNNPELRQEEDDEGRKERYREWWLVLHELQRSRPGYLQHLHYFNLGWIEHRYIRENDGTVCYGCRRKQESNAHVFQECDFSRELWNEGFKEIQNEPFTLQQMTTPQCVNENDARLLRKMSEWIGFLLRARSLERTNNELEDQMKLTQAQMKHARAQELKNIQRQYRYNHREPEVAG